MAFDWQTEYHRYRRYFTDIGEIYRKKGKVRVYTGIVLSLATISFFLFFAIKPTVATIAKLIKTIQDQKLVTEQFQNKINALGTAQTEYNLAQGNIPLVSEALPTDTQASTLIKELEASARQAGITIESIKLDQVYLRGNPPKESQEKTQSKETAQPINFTLSVSGDYQSLKTFLQSLATLRRIISVESFVFKTEKVQGQSLGLSLNARAFYFAETSSVYLKENQ